MAHSRIFLNITSPLRLRVSLPAIFFNLTLRGNTDKIFYKQSDGTWWNAEGNNSCTLRSNISQPGGLRHSDVCNAVNEIVSYRFQFPHCICIIYFFTLFPFKHFYPSFVEIFYWNSRHDISRLILAVAAHVCRKHVRAKMMCWRHHKIFG